MSEWLPTPSGARLGRNPAFEPDKVRVDTIDFGPGGITRTTEFVTRDEFFGKDGPMTATTQTLASWLLEQIAADEAAVQGATHWEPIYTPGASIELTHDGLLVDPAHVLAVCAAHRTIVEMHPRSVALDYCETCFDGDFDRGDEPTHEPYPCPTLRALASIYAGREGFREEWAL